MIIKHNSSNQELYKPEKKINHTEKNEIKDTVSFGQAPDNMLMMSESVKSLKSYDNGGPVDTLIAWGRLIAGGAICSGIGTAARQFGGVPGLLGATALGAIGGLFLCEGGGGALAAGGAVLAGGLIGPHSTMAGIGASSAAIFTSVMISHPDRQEKKYWNSGY